MGRSVDLQFVETLSLPKEAKQMENHIQKLGPS